MSVQTVLCMLRFTSKITQEGKILKIGGSLEKNTRIFVEAGQKPCVHRAERQRGELENKMRWIINICWCGRHSSFVLQASLDVITIFLCVLSTAEHYRFAFYTFFFY